MKLLTTISLIALLLISCKQEKDPDKLEIGQVPEKEIPMENIEAKPAIDWANIDSDAIEKRLTELDAETNIPATKKR